MESKGREKTLLHKNELRIIKNLENETQKRYTLTFDLENNTIDIEQLININIIKLIYDLNVDLFESITIDKINESEANIFILCKDLLKDIGWGHYYLIFHIQHLINVSQFIITPILTAPSLQAEKNMEQINLNKCIMHYCHINLHKTQFTIDAIFAAPDELTFSTVIERVICNIIYKIFNRVKQFVYTITIR